MSSRRMVLRCALIALAMTFAAGCSSGRSTRKLQVTLKVDHTSFGLAKPEQLPSMDVDLIGLDDTQLAKWDTYKMSDYWRAQSGYRHDAASNLCTLRFGPQGQMAVLEKTNPFWDKWKMNKATHLLILANLPGFHPDQEEKLDIPLERYRWNADEVTITIRSTGMTCDPPPNPEKKK